MIIGVFKDEEDWVRVRYSNGLEIDMPRNRYVRLRLKPPFCDLPQEPDTARMREVTALPSLTE